MKGFVFALRNNRQKAVRLPNIRQHSLDVRNLLSRYGVQFAFAVMFLLGLVVGAISGKGFDREVFDKLDLLFVTNIDTRMEMGAFELFISCFVSYFLFVFCIFLAALSAWGFTAIPLLSALKGFTVGLSTAFIFSQYQLSGIGFYILVVLPGTVLFLFALIRYATHGFRMSIRILRLLLFDKDSASELRDHIKLFVKKTMFALLSVGACAAADMILWILFAGKFEF